jgi:uncharacterized protein YcbK (DUF882 family)
LTFRLLEGVFGRIEKSGRRGLPWRRCLLLARRKLLQLGFGVAASAAAAPVLCSPTLSWAQAAFDADPRGVAFHNLHTGESLTAIYWDQGRYVPDALQAVNKVLRDFRTGDEHPIDPRLLDLLHGLNGKIDNRAPIQVISGYRSPQTNAMLHERSNGVANKSLHMQGMAIDIRVPGVQLDYLHKAALDMSRGGVGFYPQSDFVHVDVGAVRHWNGV